MTRMSVVNHLRVSAADRSSPNSPQQPTCRRTLVSVTDDELPAAPSRIPPLPLLYRFNTHPFPRVDLPKLFACEQTKPVQAAGFSDSSVSLTDPVSQLNRETARSVTVSSTTRVAARATTSGSVRARSDGSALPNGADRRASSR